MGKQIFDRITFHGSVHIHLFSKACYFVYFQCLYKLDIEVRLSNNDVIRNFQVPVPVIISEKNKEVRHNFIVKILRNEIDSSEQVFQIQIRARLFKTNDVVS